MISDLDRAAERLIRYRGGEPYDTVYGNDLNTGHCDRELIVDDWLRRWSRKQDRLAERRALRREELKAAMAEDRAALRRIIDGDERARENEQLKRTIEESNRESVALFKEVVHGPPAPQYGFETESRVALALTIFHVAGWFVAVGVGYWLTAMAFAFWASVFSAVWLTMKAREENRDAA